MRMYVVWYRVLDQKKYFLKNLHKHQEGETSQSWNIPKVKDPKVKYPKL